MRTGARSTGGAGGAGGSGGGGGGGSRLYQSADDATGHATGDTAFYSAEHAVIAADVNHRLFLNHRRSFNRRRVRTVEGTDFAVGMADFEAGGAGGGGGGGAGAAIPQTWACLERAATRC